MKLDLPMPLTWVTAREEQAWNVEQLLAPVAVPQARLWAYHEPAVVLGCGQRACAAEAAPWPSVDVVLRESGGGAVLVGPWMLGLSVVLPSDHPLVAGGPVASYRWLGELGARVLGDLGIPALAVPPDQVRGLNASFDNSKKLDWACFAGISPWEVVAGGRKLLGLAQLRRRHSVLLVGGLLLGPPAWPLLTQALRRPATHVHHLISRTTSLAGELDVAPALLEVAHPLAWALQAAITDGQSPCGANGAP